MKNITDILKFAGRTTIAGAPGGVDSLVLADLARAAAAAGAQGVVFVARDDRRLAEAAAALAFFAPDLECLEFPAWDCLPYDRVSPNVEIVARRIDTLTRLLHPRPGRVLLTTVSALLQRVPPQAVLGQGVLAARVGERLDPEDLVAFLQRNGYGRAQTVMEPGEYAVRGGIIDLFATGDDEPLRLDFFGDELEAVRAFDPTTQRTHADDGQVRRDGFTVKPVSEVFLDPDSVSRFRSRYRELFGAAKADDALYQAVSEGVRHMGMEHWLPLFHDRLETLFDYAAGWPAVLDHQGEEARDSRLDLIVEYYAARRDLAGSGLGAVGGVYNPVPPESLFLDLAQWDGLLAERPVGLLSPFRIPEGPGVVDAGGRAGHSFADARVQEKVNVFDAVRGHVESLRAGRRVVVAALSNGSRERLRAVLVEHGVGGLATAPDWAAARALPADTVAMVVLDLERGFETGDLAVLTEQDILGERLSRPSRRRIRPENFITETSTLAEGDLVVHVNHGIGRYDGLVTLEVLGAPHDCLRVLYAGDDKLFLPVENIDLLSRYGSETAGAQLDKLGGAGWQARKAKLKQRVRDMAEELIGVAAARALRQSPRATPPAGLFDEFCARFPFSETDDQGRAIDEVLADLAGGRPTDRLVCGDVGFGKTEVALRAAFVMAMSGRQVALVVPTTLLCRQHYLNFAARFADMPVRVAQLSRLVSAKDLRAAKEEIAKGTVDIAIGTHALLAKDVRFRDLGLLIVDEEQHFGVAHKEKLKKLKSDVHVLTLTATPIPRTLQLALTGVREMSLIATPPVDRLAVRTFVLPFDPVVIREALMRERHRGGQTFYVCPRIEDLDGLVTRLGELVPELRLGVAHGRMAAKDLEDVVGKFYDGAFDILLSTNIIESGLDLPSVNTIVIHRADMFGLAQLYQLRGRVGRSKVRAYAYLTLPPRQKITPSAERRLEVMQTLDTLGAGFTLASHDLDIRGAGNLLGEEQSGHIREVGIELYQQMLEEAVAEARGSDGAGAGEEDWSPQIGLGMPVLIPEDYIADLTVRLGLYRRVALLTEAAEIEDFAAELIDRFGPIPDEVENLLQTIAIKHLCRQAGVEKVDAGPKGAVVTFRNNDFANPAGLVQFITAQAGTAKLRPDHRLVLIRDWTTPPRRLEGVRRLLRDLAAAAET
ncbi:MAG: transcription-repair coupling factor [Hyphomicrobiales bacterium]|nr:transcription-repair coupling factor [Hyphomicrobiales bacterium]MCP5374023.1 transcription-repair coupling factor [Hyphomicrobiales bacterium]